MMSSVRETFESLPYWVKYAVAGVAVALPTIRYLSRGRKSPFKSDWEQDLVYVYQFPRAAVIPNISPYCLKLETWLRMADVKYENVPIPFGVMSSEGTLPFAELNGKELVDSSFIIRDLTKAFGKESVESHLSAQERGAARAFEQMIQNSTLWSYASIRYLEKLDEIFSEKVMGMKLPLFFRLMPRFLIANKVKGRLMAVGIGRHTREEQIGIGLEDLRALSGYLGDKLFLTGTRPTRADATLFGVVAQIIYIPIDTPHKDLLENECKNIRDWAERMRKRFWPDWDELCRTRALNADWKRT